MYRWWENFGPWWATAVFQGPPYQDVKSALYRMPHASYGPTSVPSGSIFGLNVVHLYPQWSPYVGWLVGFATGRVQCIVP